MDDHSHRLAAAVTDRTPKSHLIRVAVGLSRLASDRS
jgi:hypothetical protein